jgi:hypothetical protein
VWPEIKAGTHRSARKRQQPVDKDDMATDDGIPKRSSDTRDSEYPEAEDQE